MTYSIGNEFYNDYEFQLREQFHEWESRYEAYDNRQRRSQMMEPSKEQDTGKVTMEDVLMTRITLEVMRDAFTQPDGALRDRCDVCINNITKFTELLKDECND